jgi:hypothetical protein
MSYRNVFKLYINCLVMEVRLAFYFNLYAASNEQLGETKSDYLL